MCYNKTIGKAKEFSGRSKSNESAYGLIAAPTAYIIRICSSYMSHAAFPLCRDAEIVNG